MPAPPRRYAVIDIGSNAVRLLLGVLAADGAFLPETFVRMPLALGRGAFAGGKKRIRRDDSRRLQQVLSAMRLLIDSMRPIVGWSAVATAVLREAANRDEVLSAIKKNCDMRVRVLSGDEEAAIIGRFAAAQFPDAAAVLNVDTGGGSTDCALLRDGAIIAADTFAVGTARLNDAAEKARLRAWLRKTTAGRDAVICGSGGSVRKLQELCGGITPPRLTLWRRRLRRLPPLTLAARYDLSPDRAATIVAAIDIYRLVLAAAGDEIFPIRGGLGEAVIRGMAAGYLSASR